MIKSKQTIRLLELYKYKNKIRNMNALLYV